MSRTDCNASDLPRLLWTTDAQKPSELSRRGYAVLRFERLQAAARLLARAGATRRSLRNPAAAWLAVLDRHPAVAMLGVACRDPADLRSLHGLLVEPAVRRGRPLLLQADTSLEDLAAAADRFTEPSWGYAWTLERVLHLAERVDTAPPPVRPLTVSWWRRLLRRMSTEVASPADSEPLPGFATHLDPRQRAAVLAGDGVVQVIAPAGSGKTTVLVARVATLVGRGTPARQILCCSFNRDAQREIANRLRRVGIEGVVVRSFHALGRQILQREGQLRPGLQTAPDGLWRQLAEDARTATPGGLHLEPEAARAAVSDFKLARLVGPRGALAAAEDDGTAHARSAARLYALYEEHLARENAFDFDDLVSRAVRLLRNDPAVRARWQARFTRVLVDEYQDIEPAQALLVGLLAAPQDSLFCVGDEDQCIYAWRRASVRRVVELDQTYPGLERHSLAHNYRCGQRITAASRRLISRNRVRFRKPLHAGAPHRGRIVVHRVRDLTAGAALVAGRLRDADPQATVVLARTGRLLEEVARACADAGISAGVELATVHAAKGREWDHVLLFGADESRFPHLTDRHTRRRPDPAVLEDERRLFYVAMTRARCVLEIVCSRGAESVFLRDSGLRRW
jgi:superfamily I DNA/RNA helicase